ncbi:MAG: phosphoglycerate mutase (2,3-diphosphoglycerate-independent) [Crocinitomicaceae bacterium]|nr:phosphoglycerate mutase (2,3-diphosphoglycerate-independent) [Crocinitomicaceae bacterium]
MRKKVGLIILDGWGFGKGDFSDGVHLAKTPYFDSLLKEYPNSTLVTYGEKVGLPEGQMGNSEVGHMNIGAGRIVYQDLLRIDNAIKDGSFFKENELLRALEYAQENNKKVHLMGLVSKGGVHSSFYHLLALCDLIKEKKVDNCFIHAFTDGRDCNPKTGISYLKELENYISNSSIKIASIIGRYYAMDRDNRWERIKKAYNLLVKGDGESFSSVSSAINSSYENGITDEFILPSKINNVNGLIQQGDVVICFNFRTDRCREISKVLTQEDFPEFQMKTIPLHYVTMTNYDKTFEGVNVVYKKENLSNTLGEVISTAKRAQLRMAETEKYPHVTYFFNGGKEQPFALEDRIMENSPKVKTYDLKPQMSAFELTDAVCKQIEKEKHDFICLNFANPDMVGHTGNKNAIIQACEVVDKCLERVIELGKRKQISFIIIADHGNADVMVNEDGTPNTAHSLNLVPFIVVDRAFKYVNDGILADVAPSVLALMDIQQPGQMTGKSLLI